MSATSEPHDAWHPAFPRTSDRAARRTGTAGRGRAGPVIDPAALEPVLVQLGRQPDPLRRIGITAAQPAEGTTTISVELARLCARRGHTVALIEADWRAPVLATTFGLAGRPGFADVILGEVAPMEGAHAVAPNLTVVPAGHRGAVEQARLDDTNARAFLDLIEARFDLAILDCPPVGPPAGRLADTAALASLVDGFVLVVGAERTRRAVAERACADLEAVGGTALGTVLNGVRRPIPRWLYRWLG